MHVFARDVPVFITTYFTIKEKLIMNKIAKTLFALVFAGALSNCCLAQVEDPKSPAIEEQEEVTKTAPEVVEDIAE